MTRDEAIMHHHKRRRRRQDKPAISAKLVLDGQLKGDFGVLSEDLMRDLYPVNASVQGDAQWPGCLSGEIIG